MRKIEILTYTCPLCNGDLMCAALDFSFKKELGGRTKTSYKCMACGESFYSIEDAVETNQPSEFHCLYCKEKATYLSLRDDWADYWKCVPCKVSFERTYSPAFEGIQTVNMYTVLHGSLYVLRQFMDCQKSRVEMLPENPEDIVAIAREFDYLFPNVNPININSKLSTYLLFG
jgi:DNA-directed RNA polymerase subunit RPC12/RpoP